MPNTNPNGADALRVAAQAALTALETLHEIDTETECITIDVRDEIDALRTALASAAQPEREPHPPHRDCGCAECAPSFEADEPTLTVTMRYDLSPDAIEGAIRNRLIEMGWTPPDAPTTQAAPAPSAQELLAEIQRLQRALAFWLPQVPSEDHLLQDRISHDAFLLAGYSGPDEPSANALGHVALTAAPAPSAQGDALDAACQRACKELPEGMSLAIQLERDAGWVELHGSYGGQIDLPDPGDSLVSQLHQAIDAARAAKEGDKP